MEESTRMAKRTKPNRRVPRIPAKDVVFAEERIQQKTGAARLLISRTLFEATLSKLAERSEGLRESAGIWVGTMSGDDATVTNVYLHHELCDDRGSALSLELSEDAKFALYRTLAASGLKLIALIHTHPEEWVGLSWIDEQNQICSRIGLYSLVVPWYGRKPWELASLGVHLRGDSGWQQIPASQISRHLIISE
jgi:hypothetical protein